MTTLSPLWPAPEYSRMTDRTVIPLTRTSPAARLGGAERDLLRGTHRSGCAQAQMLSEATRPVIVGVGVGAAAGVPVTATVRP